MLSTDIRSVRICRTLCKISHFVQNVVKNLFHEKVSWGQWTLCCYSTPLCIINISVNSLRSSDAILRQIYGSTLAQVMAWCLTAPSHYLNQCWFIISKVQWHSFIWGQSHKRYLSYQSIKLHWKLFIKDFIEISHICHRPGPSLVGKGACRLFTNPWWRNQMETFSALLAICEGNHRWISLTRDSDAELWCFLRPIK